MPTKNNLCLGVPNEIIDSTVEDIFGHPDTEVIKRGNRIRMRRNLGWGMATLDILLAKNAADKA
ncbi:MAG: hypothetical protein HFH39_04175 [Lachnospiraceae bacterium]|jgi:hypothetical protein|nr:hypothetical protein [Lachnospiraceae bacterium]